MTDSPDNIVTLPGVKRVDVELEPTSVLKAAMEEGLALVQVVGLYPNGDRYYWSSVDDQATECLLLAKAQKDLLDD